MKCRFLIAFVAFLERIAQSTFSHSVMHVVRWCAQKQVLRVDASSIIAFVQHPEIARNRSISYFPHISVSGSAKYTCCYTPKNPAITVRFAECVVPTGFGFCNFGPEKIWQPLLRAFDNCFSRARMAAKLITALRPLEFSATIATFHLNHTKLLLSMVRADSGLIPVIRSFLTLHLLNAKGKDFCGLLS